MVAPVTSGLVLDLVASKVGDVDGSSVSTWANTPTGGLGDAVLTSGDAATYRRAGTPNGGPVVRFANAQYSFANTAAFDSGTSAEFFAVVRTDGSTGNGPGFFQFGGSDYTYYTFSDGNVYDGSFTNSRYSFPLSTASDWHIYNVSHTGTTRTTRIDGVVVHSVDVGFTPPSQSTLAACFLGRQFTNYPWHGDIAEVLAYNQALSAADRASVYNYLRAAHLDVIAANPVTTGLVIDLIARGQSSPVATWTDSSPAHAGNGTFDNGSVQATRIDNATPNGGPAIHFVDTGYVTSNIHTFDTSTSAEMFGVVRDGGADGNLGFYQLGGGSRMNYTLGGYIYDGSFTNTSYAFPAVSSANWHIYNVSHDGTTRITRIDGIVVDTQTVGFTPPSMTNYDVVRISRSGWLGDIAELVVYRQVLSSTDRSTVYSYLRNAHMVTAAAPDTSITVPPIAVKIALFATLSDPVTAAVTMPPLSLAAAMPPATATEPTTIPLGPLNISVTLSMSEAANALILPPISAGITILRPALGSISITLSTPQDQDSVATPTPDLVVAVISDDAEATYTVQVQYADNADFTDAVTLSEDFAAVDGGAILKPTSPVFATTFWRARLLQDDEILVDFSAAQSFQVSGPSDPASLPVTWTVDSSADRPIHLWHLSPAGPSVGDTVTAYGQGFPDTGHITFGDLDLPVTSWSLVGADEDNDSDDTRLINDDTVTCEHYEVTFVAPNYDGPGAALTVEA